MALKSIFFPGSFDPFTKGHEAIVHKALEVVDHVIIGTGVHSSKTSYFTLDIRKDHINVKVCEVKYDHGEETGFHSSLRGAFVQVNGEDILLVDSDTFFLDQFMNFSIIVLIMTLWQINLHGVSHDPRLFPSCSL